MDRFLNIRMLSHPVNWLIVWTVLLFAGLAWALVHGYASGTTIAAASDPA